MANRIKKTSKNSQKGISVVELLLVIGIVAVLAAAATPFLVNFITRSHYDGTVDMIIGSIRKAQGYSIDGKLQNTWGVCIQNNSIRVYNQTCSSSSVTEDYPIPGTITVTGFADTTFSPGRGEPSQELTIVISSPYESKTININKAGGMTVN